MSEHKSSSKSKEAEKVTSESESNDTATSIEGASCDFGPGVMAFKSLQGAADDSPHSNSITQLQAIVEDFVDNDSNGILQLKAMADARVTTLNEPIQRQENNTGLPDNLKSGMENLSGLSMDDVKVHRNSDKPAQLQAHAYAQGTDIHLGPDQEKHLPHELGHVVQQKQGRVKPTMQMKGKVNVNDDTGLEKEADVMGAKALSLVSAINGAPSLDAITLLPTVQLYDFSEEEMEALYEKRRAERNAELATVSKGVQGRQDQGYQNERQQSEDTYDNPVKGSSDEERIRSNISLDEASYDNFLANAVKGYLSSNPFDELISEEATSDKIMQSKDGIEYFGKGPQLIRTHKLDKAGKSFKDDLQGITKKDSKKSDAAKNATSVVNKLVFNKAVESMMLKGLVSWLDHNKILEIIRLWKISEDDKINTFLLKGLENEIKDAPLKGNMKEIRANIIQTMKEDQLELTEAYVQELGEDKVDNVEYKKLAKKLHEKDLNSGLQKIRTILNGLIGSRYHEAQLDISLIIPIAGVPGADAYATIDFKQFVSNNEEKDNEIALESQIGIGLKAQLLKIFKVGASLAVFIRSKAQDITEALNLMDFGFYKKTKSKSESLAGALWKKPEGIEAWQERREALLATEGNYVDVGYKAGVEASVKVASSGGEVSVEKENFTRYGGESKGGESESGDGGENLSSTTMSAAIKIGKHAVSITGVSQGDGYKITAEGKTDPKVLGEAKESLADKVDKVDKKFKNEQGKRVLAIASPIMGLVEKTKVHLSENQPKKLNEDLLSLNEYHHVLSKVARSGSKVNLTIYGILQKHRSDISNRIKHDDDLPPILEKNKELKEARGLYTKQTEMFKQINDLLKTFKPIVDADLVKAIVDEIKIKLLAIDLPIPDMPNIPIPGMPNIPIPEIDISIPQMDIPIPEMPNIPLPNFGIPGGGYKKAHVIRITVRGGPSVDMDKRKVHVDIFEEQDIKLNIGIMEAQVKRKKNLLKPKAKSKNAHRVDMIRAKMNM